jgi:LysR family transcriptional regulator, cys regulon transcriptional activator
MQKGYDRSRLDVYTTENPMTLTQLRYLVAIVDANLNITLAAERVHATQPGLSKQIKQLEDGLGFLLFTRKGRSLEGLTQAGTEVLSHGRQMLLLANNIRTYAANARQTAQGNLTIVTTPLQARYILPQPIAQLKAKHVGVSVHLQASAEHEVLAKLKNDQADLAILSTSGAIPEAGFAIALYQWRRIAIVPKTHPLAAIERPTLALLAAYPVISYESSNRPTSSLLQAFQQRGLELKVALTAPESDLIKSYVQAGMGVGIVAEMSCYGEQADSLVRLALPKEIPTCICWAVLPENKLTRDYVLDLIFDIAPQLDRIDITRGINGTAPYAHKMPPTWLELTQSYSF